MRFEESVQRFIPYSPQGLFEHESLFDYETTFSWRFEHPRDLIPWVPSGLDAKYELEGPGLRIQSSGTILQLTRNVDFEAETVDQIEVFAASLLVAGVVFEWAGSEGVFEPGNHVLVSDRDIQRKELDSARFPLKGNNLWAGRISQIRLTIMAEPEKPILLHEIRGAFSTLSAKRLSEAMSQAWLVDLGGEVRSSLIQLPGLPVEREVEVSRGAVFRFAYGVPASVELPVRFSVIIEPEQGEPRILFETTVHRSEAGWGVWKEEVLDLSQYAGAACTLRLDTWADGRLDANAGLPAWGNPEVVDDSGPRPPNVVLISIDTLRADHMSLYGYERDTTPNIDSWARRFGVVFQKTVATSPWTLPSHASLFTGLNAHHHGVNHHMPAPASLTTLAETLRRAGYASLAVTGGGYLHPSYGLNQGFDVYRYWTGEGGSSQELESGIEAALKLLENYEKRPLFLFFHTFEVHTPYRPRQPYFTGMSGLRDGREVITLQRPGLVPARRLNQTYFASRSRDGTDSPLDEKDTPLVMALYDAGIAHTDAQLNRVLTKLNESSIESLVVLTSDHGEMLGEHGLAGHYTLYEENLMVPLVIQFPGGRGAGRVVRQQTSLVDVMPTILDALGLEPFARFDGSSLMSAAIEGKANGRRIAWSYAAEGDHGLAVRVDNRLKFIFRNSVWPEVRGFDELYRIDRDPNENENLDTHDEASAEQLRRETRRVLRNETPGLRVHVENQGSTLFRGSLEGRAVTRAGLKSEDLACNCVIWQENGRVDLNVPPGEAFTLVLEENRGRHLRLIPATGGKADAPTLDVTTLHGATTFACTDSSCTEGACMGTATCITVWREGERPPEEMVSKSDQDLEKQLRALGYVK